MHTYTYSFSYTYSYTYTYIRIHIYIYSRTFIRCCPSKCVHIYIHTYIHLYTYITIRIVHMLHTYIRSCPSTCSRGYAQKQLSPYRLTSCKKSVVIGDELAEGGGLGGRAQRKHTNAISVWWCLMIQWCLSPSRSHGSERGHTHIERGGG